MAQGFDALLDALAERTALSNDLGARRDSIRPWIEDFYHAQTTLSEEVALPTVDEAFVDSVWSWLKADEGIICQRLPIAGASAEQTGASSSTSVPTEEALTVSEERAWLAIAGHGVDHKRLPASAFQLLSIIASTTTHGIYQPELVAKSGQDKRSVPQRTDYLEKHNYIIKRRVTWKATATSWLVLKKLAPANGDVSTSPHGAEVSIAKSRPAGAIAREIVEFLKTTSEDTMVSGQALREKLGVVAQRLQRTLLNHVLVHMSQLGWIKIYYSQKAGGVNIMAGVSMLRVPDEHELDGFESSYWKRDIAKELIAGRIEMTQLGHEKNSLVSPLTIETDEEIAADGANAAICGTWRPDNSLQSQAMELVTDVQFPGLDSTELGNRIGLSFARKSQEILLSRMTSHWTTVQPAHLRHFSLVRDIGLRVRAHSYLYRHFDSHQQAVARGDTTWPAVGCKSANQLKRANLDQWGFKPLAKGLFVSSSKQTSMASAFKLNWKNTARPSSMKSYNKIAARLMRGSQGIANVSLEDKDDQISTRPSEAAIADTASTKLSGSLLATGHESLASLELAELKKRLPIHQKQWKLFIERGAKLAKYILEKEQPGKRKRTTEGSDYAPESKRLKLHSEASTVADGQDAQPDRTCHDSERVDKARCAQLELEYLTMARTGWYVNPPTRLFHNRGRPKQRLICVFKSAKLAHLPWFVADPDEREIPVVMPSYNVEVEGEGSPAVDNHGSQGADLLGVNQDAQPNPGPQQDTHEESMDMQQDTGNLSHQKSTRNVASPAARTNSPASAKTTPFSLSSWQSPSKLKPRNVSRFVPKINVAGGTLGLQRREVVYFIVQRNGGVYPGDREIGTPFAVEWLNRYGKHASKTNPDTLTAVNAMKYMVEAGTLKQAFFTMMDLNGVARTKSIVIIPDTPDEAAKVRALKDRIASKLPSSYIPELDGSALYVEGDLNPRTAPDGQTETAGLQYAIRQQRLLESRKYTRSGVRFSALAPSNAVATPLDHAGLDPRTRLELAKLDDRFGREWLAVAKPEHGTLSKFRVTDYAHNPQAIFVSSSQDGQDGLVGVGKEQSVVYGPRRSPFSSGDPSATGGPDAQTNGDKSARESLSEASNAQNETQLERDLLELAGVGRKSPVGKLSPLKASVIGFQNRRQGRPLHHPLDDLRDIYMLEMQSEVSSIPERQPTISDDSFITITMATPSTPQFNKGIDREFVDIWSSAERYNMNGEPCSVKPRGKYLRVDSVDPWTGRRVRARFLNVDEKGQRQAYTRKERPRGRPRNPDGPIRGSWGRLTEKDEVSITDGEAYALIACVIVVQTLTDSSLDTLDWRRVAACVAKGPAEVSDDNALDAKRRFEVVSEAKSLHIKIIRHSFEEWFVAAYANGDVPSLDFNHLDEYDWENVCDLTYKQIPDWLKPPATELPKTREEFEERYRATIDERTMADRPLKPQHFTMYAKRMAMESISSNIPFWKHDEKDVEDAQSQTVGQRVLAHAININRANIMTPDHMWNKEEAQKKTSFYGFYIIDHALREMDLRNMTIRKEAEKDKTGRNLLMNPTYEKPFADQNFVNFRKFYSHSIGFKKHLDESFKNGGPSSYHDLFYHVKDGEVMAIIEMLMKHEIQIEILVPPPTTNAAQFFDTRQDQAKFAKLDPARRMSIWGFGAQDYKTMHVDQANLTFPLRIRPTASYTYGTLPADLSTLPKVPTELDGISSRLFPLWSSIHGEVLQRDWFLVLGAIAFMQTFRPGMTARHSRLMLGAQALNESEIRAINGWLQAAGMLRPTVGGGSMLRGEWWKIVGEALSEGAERGVHELEVAEPTPDQGLRRYGKRLDSLRDIAPDAPRRAHRPNKRRKIATE